MRNPLISVVVTTKNEEQNIESCLLSIINQTFRNIELIVIDNHSTDKTLDIARQYTNHVYSRGPERSAQRNMGLMEIAKGEYAIYLDADMTITQNLIETCVRQMQASPCVGLYIPERVVGETIFAKIRKFERSFYDGTPIDALRFFELYRFKEVGGFDSALFEKGSGEDWDLNLKFLNLGTIELLDQKFIAPVASLSNCSDSFAGIYHNESEDELIPYLLKKRYYANGFKSYRLKWRGHPYTGKQFSLSYRLIGVFVEKGKWRKILRHPIKFLGVVSLKLLVGLFALDKLR